MKLTLDPVLQALKFDVGVIDSLIESKRQIRVFLCQRLVEILLVVNLLRNLVGPKAQSPSGALHDCIWTKATKNTSLVVFTSVQRGDDCIGWLDQPSMAGRTFTSRQSATVFVNEAELTTAI